MTNKYAEAGVDIDKGNEFVERIKPLVSSTFKSGVISNIGGFAGLYSLDKEKYKDPVLVSSTDGVGTKLKIAFLTNKHDTIGIDLVAMCVNDVIVCGAQPLFFLDYFASGILEASVGYDVVKGIANGCKESGCALIGGETAELPGFYAKGEYDLAGFVVGVVEKDKIIDGSEVSVGNVLVGIASSGLHSNGYSLVRKVLLDDLHVKLDESSPELGGKTFGEVLLTPTKIYVNTILNLIKKVKINALIHITGGGFVDNIPRLLPKNCKAVVKLGSWEVPPIFRYIQYRGQIPPRDMLRTFNCGIGMVLVVSEDKANETVMHLKALKEEAYVIGHVERMLENDSPVMFRTA
jgi:phosphoribosylformylglycinamidine cyclo-ligase